MPAKSISLRAKLQLFFLYEIRASELHVSGLLMESTFSSESVQWVLSLPVGETGRTEVKTAGSAAEELDNIGWAWFQ